MEKEMNIPQVQQDKKEDTLEVLNNNIKTKEDTEKGFKEGLANNSDTEKK
jgi:hypothetical protein